MMESEYCGIHSLPDEIILMIMKSLPYFDCNSFMRTCKLYYDMLKSSHSLWRVIYKNTAGKEMFNITAANSEGNWMSDLRQYLSLRETLMDLIVGFSPNHFSDTNAHCGLESVKEIFSIALSSNSNYYCTVSIIQKYIKEANRRINTYVTKSPYTLTEVHYGKMMLRYLMHAVLAVKWAQNEAANLLTPVIVLNFFKQWIDPLNMHSDENVKNLIRGMTCDVDRSLLVPKIPLADAKTNVTCVNGIYTEREVLLAISHYMYKQRGMTQLTAFNEDTLDVVKTIKSNSGHAITLGAIFEAIARGFGITSCQLVVFSEHAYLEWRCNSGFYQKNMKFNLVTGDLQPMGRCPYAGYEDNYGVRYFAETFAAHIANSYVEYMAQCSGWRVNNATHFLHFITNVPYTEYYNFILYARGLDHTKLAIPFNMEYLHEEHINCVHALLALNVSPAIVPRSDLFIHQRVAQVLYCVGLICLNKVHDYVCVIRDWDSHVEPEFRARQMDPRIINQPHYKVIAMDQTERYISQDNLMVVSNPSRIHHLEEAIAKEFSHFNGFFYVPNKEKQLLYPDDLSIGNAYASQRKLYTHNDFYESDDEDSN